VQAKELFAWAKRLYDRARYAEAISKFEEAYALRRTRSSIFNIGKCYEQLGETAKALRAYRDYLRLAPDAGDKETVSDAIANLERRLKRRACSSCSSSPTRRGAHRGRRQGAGSSPASVELTAGNQPARREGDGYDTVERAFVMSTMHATEITISLKEDRGGERRQAAGGVDDSF